ncbi:MAG: VCBS repeat-containing protein [Acidobacteriota bacterium]
MEGSLKHPVGEDAATPQRARRRRRGLLVALLLLVAIVTLVFTSVRTLERDALQLAETGQTTIRLLDSLRDALEEGRPDKIAEHYAPDALLEDPASWRVVDRSTRDGIDVMRWQGDANDTVDPRQAAAGWLEWLGAPEDVDLFKIKLDRILAFDDDGAGATVRAFLWRREHHEREAGAPQDAEAAVAQTASTATQPPATRESRVWMRLHVGPPADDPDGPWRIDAQELLDGETVAGQAVAFTDVAEAAGIDFVPRHNPAWETDEWFPRAFGIVRYGAGGVAAADYDGDGWDDLFFGDGESSRLYRNRGDGTFDDVTEAAGLPSDLAGVHVALLVDFDEDGDRDLFAGVATGPNRLFRNEGNGTFEDVTEGAGLGGEFSVVAAAADYDGDGLVDLYIGRYLDPRVDLPTTLFYTRNGAPNKLLRNLGDLRFEDVTEATGTGDTGLTLGVAFADYDGDGDQDLYVANDFGRNTLLRNDGPQNDGSPTGGSQTGEGATGSVVFTDASVGTADAPSDAIDFGYGMSSTWADLDNDRDFDLYISNVHSGQRWYGQAATLYQYILTSIRQGTIVEDLPLYREIYGFAGSDWNTYGDRMTKGNSLLVNHLADEGTGRFADVAEDAGANPFGWYWGAAALDFDHDGRLDLYAANGWISAETTADL